jgi:hypothetical protein
VRDEFLSRTEAGAAVRARPPSSGALWQSIVELAVLAHGYLGVGTFSSICTMSSSASWARRNS